MALSQTEYEVVMALQKEFEDGITPLLLDPGLVRWTRSLFSPETQEEFILDYHKGSIAIEKFVVNHRYRQSIILLRYCHTGRHTNPDGISFADKEGKTRTETRIKWWENPAQMTYHSISIKPIDGVPHDPVDV